MGRGEDDLSLSMWERRLLTLLSGGKKLYGLQMVDAMESIYKKRIGFSLVYPNLQKLEQRGFVVSEEAEESVAVSGAKRKYYKITGLGFEALDKDEASYEAMRSWAGGVFEGIWWWIWSPKIEHALTA
jgi:PadR family transcriptional regulator, regulatory protein PadR